jgi:hypothetical protein
MIAAIYARVSTFDQEPENQLGELRLYIAARGWTATEFVVDCNEGANGDQLLEIHMPEHVIAEFEWVEDGKPYREWLIQARVVNQYGPAVRVNDDGEGA